MGRRRQGRVGRGKSAGEARVWERARVGKHVLGLAVPIFGGLITHLGKLPQTDGFNVCPQQYKHAHKHTHTNSIRHTHTYLCILISSYTRLHMFDNLSHNLAAVLSYFTIFFNFVFILYLLQFKFVGYRFKIYKKIKLIKIKLY